MPFRLDRRLYQSRLRIRLTGLVIERALDDILMKKPPRSSLTNHDLMCGSEHLPQFGSTLIRRSAANLHTE